MQRVTKRGLGYILDVLDRRKELWHVAWTEAYNEIRAIPGQVGFDAIPGVEVASIIERALRENEHDLELLEEAVAKRRLSRPAENADSPVVYGLVQTICRFYGVRTGRDGLPNQNAWDQGLEQIMRAREPKAFIENLAMLHDLCMRLIKSWETDDDRHNRLLYALCISSNVKDAFLPQIRGRGWRPGGLTNQIVQDLQLDCLEWSFEADEKHPTTVHPPDPQEEVIQLKIEGLDEIHVEAPSFKHAGRN